MSWQKEFFAPLLQRTLENAQVWHLATHYDLSRDSRLGRAIVQKVNQVLDTEESRRQIQRVRLGELLLKTRRRRGPLVLPLRSEEDIQRVISGERLPQVRRDILKRCEVSYLKLFPESNRGDIQSFLRLIWHRRMFRSRSNHGPVLEGSRRQRPFEESIIDGQPLMELEFERGRKLRQRPTPSPRYSSETFEQLCYYLGTQAGIPPAIQEPMLRELMQPQLVEKRIELF